MFKVARGSIFTVRRTVLNNQSTSSRLLVKGMVRASLRCSCSVAVVAASLSSRRTGCEGFGGANWTKKITMSTNAASNAASSESATAVTSLNKLDANHPLYPLWSKWHLSWIEQLSPESNPLPPHENRSMRQVTNGHYVLVQPTPLRNPHLIAYSQELANSLGLSEEQVKSTEFTAFFSGQTADLPTWATPYALSIMGKRYNTNCPFGNGNGYGDGRAISIGETAMPNKWEFQLKGGGPTPFCRGADGRAVLRSSIREFLASEAMHHLGIDTTRALSLIVSLKGDTSRRPWYSEQVDGSSPSLPDINDPRLALYSVEQRQQIIQQLARQKRDPDIMIDEPNAITCRVAPSFARIGHVDLFARRVAREALQCSHDLAKLKTSTPFKELEQLIWHVAYREFYQQAYEPYYSKNDLEACVRVILTESANRIADMVAGWIRVGFAQGNFNADNCLIAGRTMDYGPFGFMDEYQPLFAKWTGSGDHFGFLNQPTAGYVNYMVLVESILTILKPSHSDTQIEAIEREMLAYGKLQFQNSLNQTWRLKMGFHPLDDSSPDWSKLEPLLRNNSVDWTLFWRQLSYVAQMFPIRPDADISTDYDKMMVALIGDEERSSPFYESLDLSAYNQFKDWIALWRQALVKSTLDPDHTHNDNLWPEERMLQANPKYVLREYMLVDAYTNAAKGDYSTILQLQELTNDPYSEGSPEMHSRYYRRAPRESLTTGGTAFMT